MTSDSSTATPLGRLVTPAEADQLAPSVAKAIREINKLLASFDPPLTNGEIVTILFNILSTNIVMSEVLSEIEGIRPFDPSNVTRLATTAGNLFARAATVMADHEARERTMHKHLALSLSPTAGNA